MRRPSFLLCALTLMSLLPLTAVQASAHASSSSPRQSDVSDLRHLFKDNIRDERWLSVGARMWLNREADSGGRDSAQDTALSYNTPSFGTNVDANDPSKDLAAGQYEPAIAARSGHVMAAWSDLSGSAHGPHQAPWIAHRGGVLERRGQDIYRPHRSTK